MISERLDFKMIESGHLYYFLQDYKNEDIVRKAFEKYNDIKNLANSLNDDNTKIYKIDDYNFIITMQRTQFSKMNVYDKQARTIMKKDKIIDQELADYYKRMIDEEKTFYKTTKESDINLISNTFFVIAKYVLGYTFDQITENI